LEIGTVLKEKLQRRDHYEFKQIGSVLTGFQQDMQLSSNYNQYLVAGKDWGWLIFSRNVNIVTRLSF
jgi:hypothetical protein